MSTKMSTMKEPVLIYKEMQCSDIILDDSKVARTPIWIVAKISQNLWKNQRVVWFKTDEIC